MTRDTHQQTLDIVLKFSSEPLLVKPDEFGEITFRKREDGSIPKTTKKGPVIRFFKALFIDLVIPFVTLTFTIGIPLAQFFLSFVTSVRLV